jgi:hypothetical protein
MNTYEIWVDLAPGVNDIDFCDAVTAYLSFLLDEGKLLSFRIRRRKLGWGPSELGEFNISLEVSGLAMLDDAFDVVATRQGQVESLHAAVFSRVRNFRSALYRDFPASERG